MFNYSETTITIRDSFLNDFRAFLINKKVNVRKYGEATIVGVEYMEKLNTDKIDVIVSMQFADNSIKKYAFFTAFSVGTIEFVDDDQSFFDFMQIFATITDAMQQEEEADRQVQADLREIRKNAEKKAEAALRKATKRKKIETESDYQVDDKEMAEQDENDYDEVNDLDLEDEDDSYETYEDEEEDE